MADETGNKGLLDHVLDFFVYAPVGLMAESRDWLPRLADRGREQLDTQVRVARLLGQVAVQRGQQEAGKLLQRGRGSNGSTPAAPTPAPTTPTWSETVTAEAEPVSDAEYPDVAAVLAEVAPDVTDTSSPVEIDVVAETLADAEPQEDEAEAEVAEVIPVEYLDEDVVTEESVGADELAIPAYDSLAASQVVQRLEGLTAAELEAVRRYEVAHRSRKTILGKVAQLQGH
jgi:hypothetical protein